MQKAGVIASRQNEHIKRLKKLSLKKNRVESRSFLVENFTIIRDALEAGFDFETLFLTQGFINQCPQKFEYLDRVSRAPYHIIDSAVNDAYSSLDTPSGITAVYKIRNKDLADGLPVVYLDNIKDPGNLGTIMRSALAFGFKNIVLGGDCVDIYNPKTIAAAKDSIFKLNILNDESRGWIGSNDRPIYATSSHEGIDLGNFKADSNFCLALGNETSGLSESIFRKAEKRIKIEMSPEIESLNVAVAASIILYNLRLNN